jgi:hypothetical protein
MLLATVKKYSKKASFFSPRGNSKIEYFLMCWHEDVQSVGGIESRRSDAQAIFYRLRSGLPYI